MEEKTRGGFGWGGLSATAVGGCRWLAATPKGVRGGGVGGFWVAHTIPVFIWGSLKATHNTGVVGGGTLPPTMG
jgi:hypothetical protein